MDNDILATTDGQQITLDNFNNPPTTVELLPLGDIALRQRNGVRAAVSGKVTNAVKLIASSLDRAAAGMLPIDFDHGLDDLGAKDGRAAAGSRIRP